MKAYSGSLFVFTFAAIKTLMKSAPRIILSIFFCFCFSSGYSQTKISSLDISRIEQKSLRKFVNELETRGIIYFEDLHPSVDSRTDSSSFDSNCHYFRSKNAIGEVWNAYLNAHPAKIWNGHVVSLGFIYSPTEKRFIFQDDTYSGLGVGQIFFIEMRVFFGLVRFPVSFVVTTVSEKSHTISFSYISEGLSKGAQTIRLSLLGPELTEIVHSSIHQTANVLRDKTLYPIYHKKAIGEVHRNITKFIEAK